MTRWLAAARQAQDAGTEPTQPTKPHPAGVPSVLSVLSEGLETRNARPPESSYASNAANDADPKAFPNGTSIGGRPLTWTGRVVSLDDRRRLSDWGRDGPQGKHWSGANRTWETGD